MQLSTHLVRDAADIGALPRGWDSERTLVLAFGPSESGAGPGVLAALADAFRSSVVLGCSTAGEIHERDLHDGTFSVAVARFDAITLAPAIARVSDAAGSRRAAEQVADQVMRPGLRALFVLADGLRVNGTELARGFNAVLPPGVVVTGGLAGDGSRFERTWVLHDGGQAEHLVAAVAFYGERGVFGHGSRGGWDVFGPQRTVTRAEGPVLRELDGRPALEVYRNYLGLRAAGLPGTALFFPLAVAGEDPGAERVVRTPLRVDEADQSVIFAGDVPQGARVQLMRASTERLVQGASQAGYQGHDPRARGPVLAVAVSCVARRMVLGERTEEEIEATLDALPPAARQVGFYSYGEIAPRADGPCDLHNQTMTVTTVGEAA